MRDHNKSLDYYKSDYVIFLGLCLALPVGLICVWRPEISSTAIHDIILTPAFGINPSQNLRNIHILRSKYFNLGPLDASISKHEAFKPRF